MKLSDNVAFHKQSLQMMEARVLMFQARGSQLVVVEMPTYQNSRQENAIHRSPKPAWKPTDIAKLISSGNWNKSHCQIGQRRKIIEFKKDELTFSKGKNRDEFVKQSVLPQIHLEMMEPKVCLVCIKLDFVTSFTDFCEAKISVNDSFSFGTKNIPTSFVFLLRKSNFSRELALLCITTKNCTGVFSCDIGGKNGFS